MDDRVRNAATLRFTLPSFVTDLRIREKRRRGRNERRERRFTVRKAKERERERDEEFSRGLPIKSAAWQ